MSGILPENRLPTFWLPDEIGARLMSQNTGFIQVYLVPTITISAVNYTAEYAHWQQLQALHNGP